MNAVDVEKKPRIYMWECLDDEIASHKDCKSRCKKVDREVITTMAGAMRRMIVLGAFVIPV